MMNGKHLGIVGVTIFIVVIAGCGVIALQDRALPDIVSNDVQQAPVTEIDGTGQRAVIVTDEVTSGPALADEIEPADEVGTSQVQPNPDDLVAAVPSSVRLDLPKFENELSEENYRWSQLLARDAIFPIYNPEFAAASEAPYDDDELVIGVALNGEAKAYSIGPLNGREMVNDTIGGVPILVSW
jgi:hypothetical protein